SPNLDVPMRGTVVVDGKTFTLDNLPGCQTHIWGKKHAFAWAWGHCNAFDGRPGAALETLTLRLRRRGIVLPPLTLFALYLGDEALVFTGFRDTLFSRGRFGTAHYELSGRAPGVRIAGEFRCRPDDMVLAPYVDPDGERCYCANTCVGDLELTID